MTRSLRQRQSSVHRSPTSAAVCRPLPSRRALLHCRDRRDSFAAGFCHLKRPPRRCCRERKTASCPGQECVIAIRRSLSVYWFIATRRDNGLAALFSLQGHHAHTRGQNPTLLRQKAFLRMGNSIRWLHLPGDPGTGRPGFFFLCRPASRRIWLEPGRNRRPAFGDLGRKLVARAGGRPSDGQTRTSPRRCGGRDDHRSRAGTARNHARHVDVLRL